MMYILGRITDRHVVKWGICSGLFCFFYVRFEILTTYSAKMLHRIHGESDTKQKLRLKMLQNCVL